MTTPVSHGYPDWSRLGPHSDIVLLNESSLDLDAVVTFGPIFVGNIPAVGIMFDANTNHFDVRITFTTDETGTILLPAVPIVVRQSQSIKCTVPCAGPYMSVSVTPSAANSVYSMLMWASPISAKYIGDTASNSCLVSVDNQNINAGATRTDTPTIILPGDAAWSVESAGTNFKSRLEAVSANGTTTLIDYVSEKNMGQRRLVHLPPSSIQIRTLNSEAVVRTFTISLAAKPFGGHV